MKNRIHLQFGPCSQTTSVYPDNVFSFPSISPLSSSIYGCFRIGCTTQCVCISFKPMQIYVLCSPVCKFCRSGSHDLQATASSLLAHNFHVEGKTKMRRSGEEFIQQKNNNSNNNRLIKTFIHSSTAFFCTHFHSLNFTISQCPMPVIITNSLVERAARKKKEKRKLFFYS